MTEHDMPLTPDGGASSTLDAYINRTLLRDAEALPAFRTIPDGALTAKLAITTASRGLLRPLGAKLALYVAGAVVVGGLLYVMPRTNVPTMKKPASAARQAAQPAPSNEIAPVQQAAEKPLAKTTKIGHTPAPAKPAMKLNAGDESNREVYKDPNYKLP